MSVQNRYSNGKIYKLVNSVDDKIYVGSTCCVLSKRLYGHKKTAKEIPHHSHRHFNKIGWDKVRIILIENVSVETKDELIMREQHYIDTLKPELNRQAAYVNCPHGRSHCMCKLCNGAGICEHGQVRRLCVPCDGNGLCIHKIQKGSCVPCGGKQVCIHGKRKQICVACGGNQLCIHGKQRVGCKTCNGDLYKCIKCDVVLASKASLKDHNTSLRHRRRPNIPV